MTEAVHFPQARTCPYRIPSGYKQLRESRPLSRVELYNGRVVWMVTGHALARELLADPRLASNQQHPEFPFATPRFAGNQEYRMPLLGVDGEEHRIHRRGLIPAFSARRIAALRPQIQKTVDQLIDDMVAQGPPGDIVTALALPASSMTICSLLGVPYEDSEFFKRQVYRMLRSPTNAEAEEASQQLQKYIADLFTRKQKENGGEDLISDLIGDQEQNRTIEHHELIGIVVFLLLAGYDTTASMIATSTYTLLQHPEQLAELRADPSLMPKAVDELLRLLSVADGLMRVATEDVEAGEHVIRKDEGVILSQALVNWDDEVYPAPETLDWHRSAVRQQMSFGHGIHQCIGQNLARAEIEIALRTLFDRLPDLRLAVPADQVVMTPADTIQGLVELFVTW